MGNCALSLSSTRVDSLGCSVDWCVDLWVDVSAQSGPWLTSRVSSALDLHWLTLHQLIWSDSLGIAAPLGWMSCFLYISKHSSLFQASKSWIEGLAIVTVYWSSFVEIKRSFGGSIVEYLSCVDYHCHAAFEVKLLFFQFLALNCCLREWLLKS